MQGSLHREHRANAQRQKKEKQKQTNKKSQKTSE